MTGNLFPGVKALVGVGGTTWLTPVGPGFRTRILGDPTHVVAMPSPWVQSGSVMSVVTSATGLAFAGEQVRGLGAAALVLGDPALNPAGEFVNDQINARAVLTLTERSVYLAGGHRPNGFPTAQIWHFDLDSAMWEEAFFPRPWRSSTGRRASDRVRLREREAACCRRAREEERERAYRASAGI